STVSAMFTVDANTPVTIEPTLPSIPPVVVAQRVSIGATVKDANGNPVGGVAVAFGLLDSDGSLLFPSGTTNASGVAFAEFVGGTTARTHTLFAAVPGLPVGGVALSVNTV